GSSPLHRPRYPNISWLRPSSPAYNSVVLEGLRPRPLLPGGRVNHQTIVVLDFGSQYTQLIARRLRELSVYSEILPFSTPASEIAKRHPAGIILSGGPRSVSEAGAPRPDPALLGLGTP